MTANAGLHGPAVEVQWPNLSRQGGGRGDPFPCPRREEDGEPGDAIGSGAHGSAVWRKIGVL